MILYYYRSEMSRNGIANSPLIWRISSLQNIRKVKHSSVALLLPSQEQDDAKIEVNTEQLQVDHWRHD